MEPQDQDDYMTTNHLLDQLAISIQQDAGRKSEEFLISQDLLNEISNQLNVQRESANTLIPQLLNSNLKHMNLLKTSNEKNKKLELQINDLKQQIKKSENKVTRQIVNNDKLNIKLLQMEQIQNNYKSMEKSLSTFQTSYQDSQKKLLSLKQQNKRLKSMIQETKVNLKTKTQKLVSKLRQQIQNLKINEVNKIVEVSKLIIQDISNKFIEFIGKQENKYILDLKKEIIPHKLAQKQEYQQKIEKKQVISNQSQDNINKSKQQKNIQIVPNSQHSPKQMEQQKQDYQIEKLNSLIVNNIKQNSNLQKSSMVEKHRISQDVLRELQQYISNSLDPQLQKQLIKLKKCQERVKVSQQCIQELTNFITKHLLSPYSNSQKIKRILTDVVDSLNSNQSVRNCLRSLNTIVPSFEDKKNVGFNTKPGYILNRI